jgi:hypothetical protein
MTVLPIFGLAFVRPVRANLTPKHHIDWLINDDPELPASSNQLVLQWART